MCQISNLPNLYQASPFEGYHQFLSWQKLGIHTPQPLQAQLLSQVQFLEPEHGQLLDPQSQPMIDKSVSTDFLFLLYCCFERDILCDLCG